MQRSWQRGALRRRAASRTGCRWRGTKAIRPMRKPVRTKIVRQTHERGSDPIQLELDQPDQVLAGRSGEIRTHDLCCGLLQTGSSLKRHVSSSKIPHDP